MSVKLDIPFYSQRGERFHSSCGAAAIACLADASVDDVLEAIGQPANKALSLHNMYKALKFYGLSFVYLSNTTPEKIRGSLRMQMPVIVLLTYGRLPKALQAVPHNGAHWALIVGYEDDFFLVHDPLREMGYVKWSVDSLKMAMRDTSKGNLPNQSLVIKRRFPLLLDVENNAGEDRVNILQRITTLSAELREEVEKLTVALVGCQDDLVIVRHYLQQVYDQLDISETHPTKAQGEALARVVRLKHGS